MGINPGPRERGNSLCETSRHALKAKNAYKCIYYRANPVLVSLAVLLFSAATGPVIQSFFLLTKNLKERRFVIECPHCGKVIILTPGDVTFTEEERRVGGKNISCSKCKGVIWLPVEGHPQNVPLDLTEELIKVA
jgi:hypothetical protein